MANADNGEQIIIREQAVAVDAAVDNQLCLYDITCHGKRQRVDDDENDEEYFRNLRYVMDSDDIDYFKNLPSGVRFRPTEEQLISAYLKPKLFNQPLPRNEIIQANIYQYNPKILTEIYKENGKGEWYFFTPRQRKYPNGDRPNRSTGDGYWKATGADKIIKDTRNIVIGFKKSLVFYKGKAPGGRKSHWIMHEYRVKDAPHRKRTSADDMRLDDVILCMIYYNNTHKSKTIMGADEDPSTSNPTSTGHTTSHDHHLIDKPVDHHHVDMHYCMLPHQQQLLQNTSVINDQPKYIASNRLDHQFPGRNNVASNSLDMAANKPIAANWLDHQFQGEQNMVANRPIAANSPDNHQFTRGVDSNNYGNQYHTMMIDTSRLYPNHEYQGICTNGTYMLPQQYNCMLPQQQQQPQQQQLFQNASWINDQLNYMAPNMLDHKFPGGNIVVANSPDLPKNHQFTGGVDSSNYENIDTSRLYPNDEYQGSCTDISNDLLSMIPDYNPMDDDILNDYLADIRTNGHF